MFEILTGPGAPIPPYEGAPRWDFRAAHDILTGNGLLPSEDNSDGFFLMHDVWNVAICRVQRGEIERPRTQAERATWDEAMTAYEKVLSGAGWTIVRANKVAVVVCAPAATEPPTTVHVHRQDVGHHTLIFEGHPAIVCALRMHLGGVTAGTDGYRAYSHTDRLITSGDIPECARALALHYGLPVPVQIRS
ncbi:hypothetical protein AB0395_21695 [Streptosporangium sp. NPDC051023]|uniref:hypothetical protein n=1 Tax=Streptosporangium sp. NPDC051023 TaxID=3155410 RepID=UPI00344F3FB5